MTVATTLLAFVPIVAAALYVAGMASASAFLAAFGIAETQFPMPFERAVFGGFLTFLIKGLAPLGYLATGLAAVSLLAGVAGFLIRARVGRRTSETVPATGARPHPLEGLGDRLGNIAIAIITVLLSLAALILVSNGAGQSAAESLKERFANGATINVELHVRGDEPIIATTIACSDSQCAYWLGDRSLVLNMADVERAIAFPVKR